LGTTILEATGSSEVLVAIFLTMWCHSS